MTTEPWIDTVILERDELQREFDKLAAAAEKRIANLEQMIEWERGWKAELLDALIGLVAWADDLRRADPAEDLRKARAAIEKVGAGTTAELDAKRYRILRRGQHWSVINGIGDTLRADQLDAEIDTTLATHNAKLTGVPPTDATEE